MFINFKGFYNLKIPTIVLKLNVSHRDLNVSYKSITARRVYGQDTNFTPPLPVSGSDRTADLFKQLIS